MEKFNNLLENIYNTLNEKTSLSKFGISNKIIKQIFNHSNMKPMHNTSWIEYKFTKNVFKNLLNIFNAVENSGYTLLVLKDGSVGVYYYYVTAVSTGGGDAKIQSVGPPMQSISGWDKDGNEIDFPTTTFKALAMAFKIDKIIISKDSLNLTNRISI